MGNKNSSGRRLFSSSSSWFDHDDEYRGQRPPPYRCTPRHHHAPAAPRTPPPGTGRRHLDRKFSRIGDNYQSLNQVRDALARSGLESSNLIVGIDFTKSNEWTGARSFNRKSLHTIGSSVANPYEQAISIIGKTLAAFDEDNLIPCFGFGDGSTHDEDVFSFYADGRYCEGFEQVLRRYRELVPRLRLSGPTSFAPVIEMAMSIVHQSRAQYHVLLIIADGQVTTSVDTPNGQGQLSPQERQTVDAIVRASYYPLSIVLVGVGDGPWDMMKEFDDHLPHRAFDNFQFVNFTDIMSRNVEQSTKEAAFALSALMEIPTQYQATLELNILGRQTAQDPNRTALHPPSSTTRYTFHRNASYYPDQHETTLTTASSSASLSHTKICPICLSNAKDMAFGCGHQTCCECGVDLQDCPICRSMITTRIKLYS